mmetsp:Transcript_19756/g.54883  ORF Transcript_19756/g.54883 Transcript_19756/m.54883 type:complete len:196 (+) Transcript_19756:113-700(+)
MHAGLIGISGCGVSAMMGTPKDGVKPGDRERSQLRVDQDIPSRRQYFTRSRMRREYKAAGVLPFTVLNGTVMALLGAEPTRTGPNGHYVRIMWGDFGGHREASDDGDSIITASREFAEETLGLFSSTLINSDSVQASTLAMSNTLRSSDTLHVSHKLRQVCSCCPLIPSRAIRLGIEPQESLPKAPSFVFPAPGC